MDDIHIDKDSEGNREIYIDSDTKNVNTDDVLGNCFTDQETKVGDKKKTTQAICINGCHSWLIVGSGFLCYFLTNGFIFHMSVLFLELQDTFQKSKAETAIVQSVASGAFLCGGILSGFIIKKIGVVKAGLVGASLDFIGLAASFFAPSIPYLAVSLGLLAGFGNCLVFQFGSTYVGLFFTGKEKLMALTISTVGAGVGSVAFPYIIDYLSEEYGFRGALLILSGIMSHKFVIILHSSSKISNLNPIKTESNGNKNQPNSRRFSEVCKSFCRSETAKSFIITIKHKIFLTYMLALSLSLGVYAAALILLVDIYESKGFDRPTVVFIYFVIGLAGLFARVLPGALKKIPHISIFDILIFGEMFSAIGFGLFPFAVSFTMNICIACMVGIYLGITTSLVTVGTMAILGTDLFPIGQGIVMTTMGIFTLSGGPLIGLVNDLTNSYDGVLYGVCIKSSLTAIILLVIRVLRTKNKTTKQSALKPADKDTSV